MGLRIKIMVVVALVAAAVFLLMTAGRTTVESPYSTRSIWQPYDGMTPIIPDQPDYFAAPFMPVVESPEAGAMAIASNGQVASIYYSADDATVVAIAAEALRDDIQRVTGLRPDVGMGVPQDSSVILIGTVGQSPLIDELVEAGKIDVSAISGKWESIQLP